MLWRPGRCFSGILMYGRSFKNPYIPGSGIFNLCCHGSVESLVLFRQETLCGLYEGNPHSPPKGEATQGGKLP